MTKVHQFSISTDKEIVSLYSNSDIKLLITTVKKETMLIQTKRQAISLRNSLSIKYKFQIRDNVLIL